MDYNHRQFEEKWQKKWSESDCFKVQIDKSKPKYYTLDMFPYPSGSGLHVGHMASYTPTDIVSRYKRACGFNVLYPIGYDAFGLPAEQYAIQTGVHPAKTTQNCIENFRRQLKSLGYSFDWSREISTCDSSFYKWTQFIFLKLFEKGLAYQKDVPVNWCPKLRTVLANEEVINGLSERGEHPVIRIPMRQWMLKITDYAERLLNDLDKLDWPEKTKQSQRNWIGKSEGVQIKFQVKGFDESFEVFTTRPDTIFGTTFMVLAPEHPLVQKITSSSEKEKVNKYVDESKRKSEIDRKSNIEKTGIFTGAYALHPFTQKEIPIWISDYVLMSYGTGSIMAVPAHDSRDFEFAQKFKIPVVAVFNGEKLPFEGEGKMINSNFLDGLGKDTAIKKVIENLEKRKIGFQKIQYKLRDWLFSRQRYWGEPFPIVRTSSGVLKAVPEEELPVLLPPVANYEPTEKGEPPLARVKDFVSYKDEFFRETDTMPGSAGSSWYFLRYTDPRNLEQAFSKEAQDYWMPVDLYIGGSEHTVGHLLYSRFWQKVLFDCGLVTQDEPFQKLVHQGTVIGSDGQRMSKSRGNAVSIDDVRERYGSDATRVYISFLGPFEKDKPWDTNGIEGVKRFLDRIWRLILDENGKVICNDEKLSEETERSLHKCIKKVTEDIERLSFNTAISAMMILVNDLYKNKSRSRLALKPLVQILMPFAPHIAEELWNHLGEKPFVSLAPWPKFDLSKAQDEKVIMAIQVNGKTRGKIEVSPESSEGEALELARKITAVSNATKGKNIIKIIYRPAKILNLIVK